MLTDAFVSSLAAYTGDTLDSGFLQVDGEELWRRTRASEFNCRPGFVEDSNHINGTASRESKCFRDIELNIPHSAASFMLTIGASLSCANTDAFWGFSDVQVGLLCCPCTAHVLPMYCPCTAHVLPMYCPCTAHVLPM